MKNGEDVASPLPAAGADVVRDAGNPLLGQQTIGPHNVPHIAQIDDRVEIVDVHRAVSLDKLPDPLRQHHRLPLTGTGVLKCPGDDHF